MLTVNPRSLSPATTSPTPGKRLHGRAAEVDDVGAAGAEVLGLREDVGEGHAVRLDDLGEDLRFVLAVSLEVARLPEVGGQILEVLGPADHRHPDPGLDGGEVAPAEPGDHDLADSRGRRAGAARSTRCA